MDLLRQSSWLTQPDPRVRKKALHEEHEAAKRRISAIAGERASIDLDLPRLTRRAQALRALLPMAELLDAGDLPAQLTALDQQIVAGQQASTWLKRIHRAAQDLAKTVQTLRQVPLDEAQLEA